MTNPIEIAKDVLSLEIAGLEALRDGLGEEFSLALSILAHVEGRIVVTGMGKSGHVARKIAATLASTGAQAMFIHPGEASHGDLGMISRKDAILALSKSGETKELGDLLAYAARFSIPVVAITAKEASTLANAAKATLLLPEAIEACGDIQAPTTSTTMMMALGDALAIALLKERGFSSDDFKGFHPGGTLGAALRRVRDLMHGPDELPLCNLDSSLNEAVDVISKYNFGCVGIVDGDGCLTGIITDGDLRRQVNMISDRSSVSELMTKNPLVTAPQALAGDILALMSAQKITALFVVEENKPVGLVHIHDCLSIGVL